MLWWKRSPKNMTGLCNSGISNYRKIASVLFHLPNFARLYWSLFWDRRAPILPKLILLLSIIYFVSPLDLVPDFVIPGLGYIDDLAILILSSRYFIKAMPEELLAEKIERIDRDLMK